MIFTLNRKVEKGERNDEMTRESKAKALLSINLITQHVDGMTTFGFAVHNEILYGY